MPDSATILNHAAEWAPYAAGYLFAVIGGHVAPPSRPLWQRYGRQRELQKVDPEHDGFIGRVVGLVERPLYVAAFLAGEPAFVGIWLGIKVAGGWKQWSDGLDVPNGPKVAGRNVFNIMLIGSAVSVAYSWVGARLIWFLLCTDYERAIVLPLGLIAAHAVLYQWLAAQKKWEKPTP